MAGASASKNPKGMNTKKDKEDMMPKTTFFSKLKRVGDTNIGTMDMIQLRDRLKGGQSSMAKKIYKCGIVQVAAFPPTLPCPELIMECASRLDIVTKSIIFDEGKRMLANISGQVVEEVFNIPQQKGMIVMLMDQAARFFQDSQDAYLALLKQNWLREGKKGVTKTSKLTRSDFKSEYGDLIVLLNRVMGSAQEAILHGVLPLQCGCTAVSDALLVELNPNLGRCTAPLWLRQMLMPRGEVVAIRTVEDIQGLAKEENISEEAGFIADWKKFEDI